MRKLRPSKIIDIDSNQFISLDRSTEVSRAEIDELIANGRIVIFQSASGAQVKAPDEERSSNAVRRSRKGT